jgi:NitT/TauT family transport system ATP-binding protein
MLAHSIGSTSAQPSRSAPADPAGTFKISMRGISQAFRRRGAAPLSVLSDFTLDVRAGEFVAIVGPSGTGKTTLLNIISGLQRPTAGEVLIDGEKVEGIQKRVGYMPARDALLPWRTALRNVEYGLELRGVRDRRPIAREMLEVLGLRDFENSYPHELSQGMRQRVAIARTFAVSPEILLMDEPFSALDAQTRVLVQELFLALWERERKTVLLVTHDVMEAITLADRVVTCSARPARVTADRTVDLERPRHVRQLIGDARFQALFDKVWDDLQPGGQADGRDSGEQGRELR